MMALDRYYFALLVATIIVTIAFGAIYGYQMDSVVRTGPFPSAFLADWNGETECPSLCIEHTCRRRGSYGVFEISHEPINVVLQVAFRPSPSATEVIRFHASLLKDSRHCRA